jgi:type IV pilus assembly protein PilY1
MNWFNHLNPIARRTAIITAVALSTLAGLPVHAATSFPDNPLMTGGAGVPPNILLILDDSGSMASFAMNSPQVNAQGYGGEVYNTLSDDPSRRSYINNTVHYNPNKT